MRFMIGGTILGILFGLLTPRFVSQKTLGWLVLGLGAVALALIIPVFISILIPFDLGFFPVLTLPLGIVCLISGSGSIRNSYRPWQVLLGMGLGAIPILFWIVFGIGELLYPH